MNHPTTITENAIRARNIAKGVIGSGCNYADGRKNGVRYKWIFRNNASPNLRYAVEKALSDADIQNFSVMLHVNKYGQGDAISVTIYA